MPTPVRQSRQHFLVESVFCHAVRVVSRGEPAAIGLLRHGSWPGQPENALLSRLAVRERWFGTLLPYQFHYEVHCLGYGVGQGRPVVIAFANRR